MGCDIFDRVEILDPVHNSWAAVLNTFPADQLEKSEYKLDFVSPPFRRRSYRLFGFLAGVRNYSCCEPISDPKGLPADCDLAGGLIANGAEDFEGHSHSWLSLIELLRFDYEKVFWNRRVHRGKDGAALAQEGEGLYQTYREFLGPTYFDTLKIMEGLGPPDRLRLVFFFGD